MRNHILRKNVTRKHVTLFTLVLLSVTGCARSVSWSEFSQHNDDANYCQSAYQETQDAEQCSIEYIAYQHAKSECQKAENPDYCVLLARHGWDNYKDIILNDKPTKEHAGIYPVFCSYKNDQLTLCSDL
ncbi:hypothetical protein SAMN04488136_13323 [Vibrio xiamenensis]|uniref:Lipoprotein n=1 Tax=Vibrio xiamenensis TaxID=861298 RepID=A0A1G8FY34_9VIBR|nr:hypothetical protein [Vibrio xiamenensis]SDH87074.1 hypothetical protein SAMN04488136_13323 [Vibrio xiamenensis]